MENRSKVENSVKFFVFLILTVGFWTNITAQGSNFSLDSNAIKNFNNGISSDNPGLRKSAIILAGKYNVTESGESLLKQLKVESQSFNRIEIIRSLYLMGNDEYMHEIDLVSKTDPDLNVREFASAIYKLMNVERTLAISSIN